MTPEARIAQAVTLIAQVPGYTQQSLFAKTPSFWLGVFTRTPLMARYERPAYRAALRFLEQVALALPEHAADALREAEAVRLAYTILYKLPLDER